jgi:type IX secretion system PorP/SprF family membrane protein
MALTGYLNLLSQELPLLSQRIFDAQYINPGVVGARELMEVTAHHRSQWVGFAGAPQTQVISVNAPVGRRLGLGGFALNDVSGPSRNIGFGLTYGYHFSIGNYNVGLGLSAGMMRFQFDGGVLNMPDLGDPLWQGVSLSSRWTPEFAVGAFTYNKRRYFGISAAQLVNIMPTASGQLEVLQNQRAHIIAGYDVVSTKEVILTPSIFWTASLQNTFIMEFGVTASFFELFVAGLHYRWNDAVIVLAGAKVYKTITLAYSYDYSHTGIGALSGGSHELVVLVAFNARYKEVCPVYKKILDKKRRNWKY